MRLNRHFIRSIEGGTPLKTTRLFLLPMGESLIAFSMRVEPLPGSHTTPPEAARRPEDGEVLEAIERVFLGSLGAAPKQPDLEKGWDAYRAELLETHGCRVPSWAELPEQVRECFAVGVAAARGEELEVPSDQWAVSREEKMARVRSSMDVVLRRYGLPPVPDVLPEGCVELGFQKGNFFHEGVWVSIFHLDAERGDFWGKWLRWDDPQLRGRHGGGRHILTARTESAELRTEVRGPSSDLITAHGSPGTSTEGGAS